MVSAEARETTYRQDHEGRVRLVALSLSAIAPAEGTSQPALKRVVEHGMKEIVHPAATEGLRAQMPSQRWRVSVIGVLCPFILQSLDSEHEADDFVKLCPTGAIQALPVSGIIVPAIVCHQLVAVRRRLTVPKVHTQRFLYQ